MSDDTVHRICHVLIGKLPVTKSAAAVAVRTGTADVDPAVTRVSRWRMDGARIVRQHARRLSRRPHGPVALARDAEHRDHQSHARQRAGLHRIPGWRWVQGRAPLHGSCLRSAASSVISCAKAPCARIQPRRLQCRRSARSLPKSLSEEEVESLLNAPVVSDPLGSRDRTMLEVLYATGLRVSELVTLKYSQLNLNQGVLRVHGKGDRERMIPLGEEAVRWLREFIGTGRGEILLDRTTEYLFPTPPRRPHDAPGLLAHHQALRPQVEHRQGTLAAHAAACLRHAPAQPRRRPARGADAAGAQRTCPPPRSTRTLPASA